MKKLLNFLRALVSGIMPAIGGGLITMGIFYIIQNIRYITTGSGWPVVMSFIWIVIEFTLCIIMLCQLGTTQINANNWTALMKNKELESDNNTNEDKDAPENESADA